MILICNLSANKTLNITRHDVKVINVDYDSTINLYRNIGKAGISIEKEIIENGGIWSDNLKYKSVLMIWNDSNLDIDSIILNSIDFRSDEVMFDSFKESFEFYWVIGHPCSIITWASTVMNCQTITLPLDNDFNGRKSKDKKLLWLAYRTGLKIFSN